MDAVAAAERRRGVEERGLGAAEAVQQQHVSGPSPIVSVETCRRPTGTSWMRSSGGRPFGQPEQALEADREVEVAAGVEPALGERLDARQLALAQAAARCAASVPIVDVGPAAGGAHAHARAVRGAADLPRVADVAQAHVVGGVEAGLGARGSARERAEGLLDLLRERRHEPARYPPRPRGTRRPAVASPLRARDPPPRHAARAACGRWSRASPARSGSTPAGPTVYARIHVGNARPFVVFSLLKRFLEHEGLRGDAGGQHHRHQRQDLRRRAGRGAPVGGAGRGDDRRTTSTTRTGSGSAAPTTSRWPRRASTAIIDLIAALIERRPRLRGRRRRLLPRALARRLRRAVAPRRRPDGPGRGRRGRRPQGGPARLRALEGHQGGRGHRLGLAVGRRAGPAGTSSAPRWPRSCSGVDFDIHGGGVDLVFPHHENEAAQTLAGARQAARAHVDAQRDAPARRREDVQVGRQHPRARRGARRGRPRRAGHVLLRRPLPPADRVLRRAPGGGRARARRGSARRGGGWARASRPEDLAPLRDAFFDALADDFNTARALAALYDWIREANRRDGEVGGATCARCSTCSAWRTCSTRRGDGPPAEAVELAERREAARGARDFAEADRLRDELRAMGWEVRDGPQGPELVPAG